MTPDDDAFPAGVAPPVAGRCAPGFEAVHDAFVANFASRGEVGAAVHVMIDGDVVVDLVGGWTDPARTRPWADDTLVDIYSVGKAVLALLVLQLVDDGAVGLDTPIAEVWPEFGAGGKGSATIAHALTHRAGVPAIREVLTDADLFDWDRMVGAIADTAAWYPPGERVVYHTNTFGHLLGEIVRRVTGERPGARLRTLAATVDADLWFGVPVAEHHRCADVIWAPATPVPTFTDFGGLDGDLLMNVLAHFNPPGYSSIGVVNTPAWRQAQIGSTSGHASASGIARLYAALLEPGRLLSPDLFALATHPQAHGVCPILGEEVTFGLGFQPTTARRPLGPNPDSFGHFGTGGALGFADPDTGLAFGYAMNHVVPRWQSSRNRALVDAVYHCLTRDRTGDQEAGSQR